MCTKKLSPLSSSGGGRAVVRTLEADQWAEVAFPGVVGEKGFNPTDIDCTGHYAFANESLRGGISQKGWPRAIETDEVDVRAGPDGLRAIWYRVLEFENGDQGGPLLLVRAFGDRAEIYGIGSYRGPVKTEKNPGRSTQITPVRLGDDTIVVAESRRCDQADDCRKQAHFHLARRGRLIEAAAVDIERIAVTLGLAFVVGTAAFNLFTFALAALLSKRTPRPRAAVTRAVSSAGYGVRTRPPGSSWK